MYVSHEVPLALLKESRVFNDIDYALVHLFEKYPDYYKFFEESIQMGRTVYLDNSLYELGSSFDPGQFLKWINTLHPTHYIIPDTFWNAEKTIEQAMDWFLNYAPKIQQPSFAIGVAQGKSYEAIVKSYRFMCSVADVVAFTFKFDPNFVSNSKNVDFREEFTNIWAQVSGWCDSKNEDTLRNATIRYALLKRMAADGIIDKFKPHHLLGVQNTLFLANISKEFEWISSIDTSNPIIYGLSGCRYMWCGIDNHIGNSVKPKPVQVLADYFEKPICVDQFDCVRYNVQIFNRLAKQEINKLTNA